MVINKKDVVDINIIGFLRTVFDAGVPWDLNRESWKITSQKDPEDAMVT